MPIVNTYLGDNPLEVTYLDPVRYNPEIVEHYRKLILEDPDSAIGYRCWCDLDKKTENTYEESGQFLLKDGAYYRYEAISCPIGIDRSLALKHGICQITTADGQSYED